MDNEDPWHDYHLWHVIMEYMNVSWGQSVIEEDSCWKREDLLNLRDVIDFELNRRQDLSLATKA